mmetsp:Transcript_8834/g.8199  ORF Transcript_8834/g.8199 Transcript_8834/m.8199 type:complete len:119 (-) Transcript_8834:1745-2101(-)
MIAFEIYAGGISIASESNTFAYSYQKDTGGFLYFYSDSSSATSFVDTGSSFSKGYANYGGVLYAKRFDDVVFQGSSFSDSFAERGGCLYLSQEIILSVDSSSFVNCDAIVKGGAAFIG